uniref:Uncharacterized protein n=1 Tax=Arundo donax TaxID=35708 RepID=A0A0A9DS30_ARUDO
MSMYYSHGLIFVRVSINPLSYILFVGLSSLQRNPYGHIRKKPAAAGACLNEYQPDERKRQALTGTTPYHYLCTHFSFILT